MKYILDTDIIIYFLKGNFDIIKRISNTPLVDMVTTIINHSELLYGAYNSVKKKQNFDKIESFLNKLNILPFCRESSRIFAEQKALLKSQGNIVADMDLMIASIALRHQVVLVTNNIKHFSRIKNLQIENWYS